MAGRAILGLAVVMIVPVLPAVQQIADQATYQETTDQQVQGQKINGDLGHRSITLY